MKYVKRKLLFALLRRQSMREPTKHRKLGYAVVVCVCGVIWGALCPLVSANPGGNPGGGWVVQMNVFAQRANALAFKHRMDTLGFEARIVASGGIGEQRYRVIIGKAATPEGLNTLRRSVEQQTGERGIITRNPINAPATESAGALFEPPQSAYLLAQAATVPAGGESIGSNPNRRFSPEALHSPRHIIDSSGGFSLGGARIFPALGLENSYDDNLTAAAHDGISSWFYTISPAIRLVLPSDHSLLVMTSAYTWVRYNDSPIDDHESWYLRGNWIWDISMRQDLKLYANYDEGVDRRGEGRRQGDAGLTRLKPDAWRRLGFGSEWDYGAVDANGHLTLQTGASDIEYINNRQGSTPGSPGTRALDRNWWYGGVKFDWRLAPKTSLVADFAHTDIAYKEAVQPDSKEDSFLLGITWEATARTSGTLKYGVLKKDFADPSRQGYSGPAWTAEVIWQPRTYSVFTLTGTRYTQESDGLSDYVLREDISLSWRHQWMDRLGTTIDLGFGEDDYRPDDRSDEQFSWGIAARYVFNPHVYFGASVRGYDRKSNEQQYDYGRRVYLLTLEVTY